MTNQGEIIGVEREDDTYAWLGIPFAEPPVGDLRWKAPIKPKKFSSRFEASEFSEVCFQREGIMTGNVGGWIGSEDCLYLNVWSPAWTTEQLKEKNVPVMMWIHGGGNTIGSADTYYPTDLVSQHEVIVVTVQYRMSNLGWFRHPALRQGNSTLEDVSGNYGTLDNIMALKWIKENIGYFGGDANNVTIFGESAGGHNVAALYASPIATGLFHKAIVQSGIISHSLIEEAESYYPEDGTSGIQSSKEIINRLLINENKANDIKDAKNQQNAMSLEDLELYLRSKNPEELLTAYFEASPKKGGMTRVFNDGHVMGEEGIYESFTNSSMQRVPIILGTNRFETKLFNMRNPEFVKWGEGEGIIAKSLSWAGITELPLEILRPDFYNAVNQYSSDSWKQRAADSPARDLIASGQNDTFVYRFDWDELPEVQGMDFSQLVGSAHAMELLFLFPAGLDNMLIKSLVVEDSDSVKKLSDQMMSYWASFAYTGNPGKGMSDGLPQWKPWSEQEKYMILDSENDQGLIMVNSEVTIDSMIENLREDTRMTKDEKCQTLFSLSYGGDIPEKSFNGFEAGYCLSLDYSDILKMIERTGEDNEQES
jgi:para-nitrobenzyl esterase